MRAACVLALALWGLAASQSPYEAYTMPGNVTLSLPWRASFGQVDSSDFKALRRNVSEGYRPVLTSVPGIDGVMMDVILFSNVGGFTSVFFHLKLPSMDITEQVNSTMKLLMNLYQYSPVIGGVAYRPISAPDSVPQGPMAPPPETVQAVMTVNLPWRNDLNSTQLAPSVSVALQETLDRLSGDYTFLAGASIHVLGLRPTAGGTEIYYELQLQRPANQSLVLEAMRQLEQAGLALNGTLYTVVTSLPDNDPCKSAPCANGGVCSMTVNGGYLCYCPHNFTGVNCRVPRNASRLGICEFFAVNPCLNSGACVGDIMSGQVCQCDANHHGVLCEEEGPELRMPTLCERQRRLAVYVLEMLTGKTAIPPVLARNVSLQVLLVSSNLTWLGVPACHADGSYSPVLCEHYVYNPDQRRCRCVDNQGYVINTNVVDNREPDCQAAQNKTGECPPVEGDVSICLQGCETDADCSGQLKCCRNNCGKTCRQPVQPRSVSNVCQLYPSDPCAPHGRCVGNMDTGDLCACNLGREGIYCEVNDTETLTRCQKQRRWALYTMELLAGNRTEPLLGNVTPREAMARLNMTRLPMPECRENGGYASRLCELSVPDLDLVQCFCLDRDGILMPDMVFPQFRPNCQAILDAESRPCQDPGAMTCYNGATCMQRGNMTYCLCARGFVGEKCDVRVTFPDVGTEGLCPSMIPLNGSCVQACLNHSDCPGRQLCCASGCSRTCVFPHVPGNESCSEGELACHNGGTCLKDFGRAYCSCPPGYTGFKCDVIGAVHFYIRLRFPDLVFREQLSNSSSPEFQRLASTIVQGVQSLYAGVTGNNTVSLLYFSKGSVLAYLMLAYTGSMDQEQLAHVLHSAVLAGRVGGLTVSRDFVFNMSVAADPCFSMPCRHGYGCHANASSERGFVCECPLSMGLQCENEGESLGCQSLPCQNGHSCTPVGRWDYQCDCPATYGKNCQHIPAACGTVPLCYNGGRCQVDETGMVAWCLCPDGYRGLDCSHALSNVSHACRASEDCQNGGSCLSSATGSSCSCQWGYSGRHCEVYVGTGCDSYPCQNGYTCQARPEGNYSCGCPAYMGRQCERAELHSCKGDCQNMRPCTASPKGAYCSCGPHFHGRHCQFRKDNSTGCSSNPCQHGYACLPQQGGGYQCACPEYMGAHCERADSVACMNDCKNGGECLYEDTYAYCWCPRGFIGRQCEIPGEPGGEVNGSLVCAHNPCQNGFRCMQRSNGSFYCDCPESWGRFCELPPHSWCNCGAGQKCELFLDCASGRCREERRCVDRSASLACSTKPCAHGYCLNTDNGGYTCKCQQGYSGVNCEVNGICGLLWTGFCGTWGGSCVGDVINGRLCACPKGRKGPMCEMEGEESDCERQQGLFNLTLDTYYNRRRIRELNSTTLLSLLQMAGLRGVPVVSCSPQGHFLPLRCQHHLPGGNVSCHCVDAMGFPVSSNVVAYPGYPPCTAPMSGRDVGRLLCERAGSLCWNGGTCEGNVYAGRLCQCAPGYTGVLCQKRLLSGQSPETSQSSCELSHDVMVLLKSVVQENVTNLYFNNSPVISSQQDSARSSYLASVLRSFAMALFRSGQAADMAGEEHNVSELVLPVFNCTTTGHFAPMQCDVSLLNGTRGACYCVFQNGSMIPGTRVQPPLLPDCQNVTLPQCPPVTCEMYCMHGFALDLHGCPMCACRKACEGVHCGPGKRCVEGGQCVSVRKPGMCPASSGANSASMTDQYHNSMQSCNATCRDDADCPASHKCCGTGCGTSCQPPADVHSCEEERRLAMSHVTYLRAVMAAAVHPNSSQAATHSLPALTNASFSGLSQPVVVRLPNCTDDGGYSRVQCDVDLRSNQSALCYCVDHDGQRVRGTEQSPPRLPQCHSKPGTCPSMPQNSSMGSNSSCSVDFDCPGPLKCCPGLQGRACLDPAMPRNVSLDWNAMLNWAASLLPELCGDGGQPGYWETGHLCQCHQGRAGPLCEDIAPPTVTKLTVCQTQQSVFRYLQAALSLPQDSTMLTNGQRMLRALPAKYRSDMVVEPRMRMAECTEEGDFLPAQCDVDIGTLAKVQCYCVNHTGAAANETYTRPPNSPSCGDAPQCRVGHPFSNGTHLVRCGPGGQGCPSSYQCMMGRYGEHYCCLEPAATDNVCRQAPDGGMPCDKGERGLRYFYNSTTRQCQQFRYSGCWGNKNNFLSKLQCEGFCVHLERPGACPRDLPVFVQTSSCPDKCAHDSHCPGSSKCCPSVCGKHCLAAYDAEPGNDRRECPRGEPLFSREGQAKTCDADSLCGPGYRCHNNVCCLDDRYGTDVCRLPPSPGPCKAHMPRFHYNASSARCELFVFGGCRGNDNNFASIEECCNSCGQGRGSCKRDECPQVPKGSFGTCLQQCQMDADCPGTHICCDNGCGTTCTAPTRNASSTCFAALELARRKLVAPALQCRPVFVPRCSLDGAWEAQQCMDAQGLCWCVDPHGDRIPGTLVRGQARCAAAARTDLDSYVEPDVCPPGEQAHCCDMKLCHVTSCPANPAAVCRVNPCGGCRAEFFDADNNKVNCTQGLNSCQLTRQAALEARLKHSMTQLSSSLLPTLAPSPSNASSSIQSAETNHTSGLPAHCTLPPVQGVCRAAFQHWFYNASAAQCQAFIWGGCGGNANNFDSPSRCYDECNPQEHPCATARCGYGEKCVVEPNDDCPAMHLCPHKVSCRAPSPEGTHWLRGVPLPSCNAEGFSFKQCHNQYCWCVDRLGQPFPGTLTTSNSTLQCHAQGAVDSSAFDRIYCGQDRRVADASCVHACRDKRCPNKPEAQCVVDVCSHNCSTHFLSPEDDVVQCSDETCDEASSTKSEKCSAPACPNGQKPRLCPDVCADKVCQGNPCTVCLVDHCTCQPYFQDMFSTTTYHNCTMAPITPCRREQCSRKLDQLRESMSPDRRVTAVEPPQCSADGAFLPRQCSTQHGCRCVDGLGRVTRVLLNQNDSCVQNDTLSVQVTMTFKELNFDDVLKDGDAFETAVLESLVAAGVPRTNVKKITLRRGSVIVDVVLASPSQQPDPALPLQSDVIQKKVQDGSMTMTWKGQNFTADSQSFSALPAFQAPSKPSPDSTPKPSPQPTPASGSQGLSTTSIIIIAVVCGAVGLVLLGGTIYCCCCRRREEATPKENIYAIPTEVKTQQTPTFAASNMLYGTTPSSCVAGQANNVYATIPEPSSQPPKQEDVIKIRL